MLAFGIDTPHRAFTRFLVDHGLAVAGTLDSMEDLRARYGTQRWYGLSDIVPLPPASLFPEQTERFFFLTHPTNLLPPSELECDFDFHHDAERTHACALERLTALFGTPEKGKAVNTLSETWRFGRMSLKITTFLKEKSLGRNDLYARHPELWNRCRISIDRNWVCPLSLAEDRWLGDLRAGETLSLSRSEWRSFEQLAPWDRGFLRLGTAAASGLPSLWRNETALGWRSDPWAAFFERRHCQWLELHQVHPARGPGSSRLLLHVANPFSTQGGDVNTVILAGEETHTLDRSAADVAAFWQLPLKTQTYSND